MWRFTKQAKAEGEFYDLGQEGGHSRRRILHATDFTGREIERALSERARRTDSIRIYENHIAIDLILKSKIAGTGGRRSRPVYRRLRI